MLLHNEAFHYLFSWANLNQEEKNGQKSNMNELDDNCIKRFLSESHRKRKSISTLHVDMRIIPKWILDKCMDVAQNRNFSQPLVKKVM